MTTSERITNGGFEPDLTSWDHGDRVYSTSGGYFETRCAVFQPTSWATVAYLSQSVNLTGVSNLTFYDEATFDEGLLKIYIDTDLIYSVSSGVNYWTQHTIPISYSGIHTLKIEGTYNGGMNWKIDDVSAIGIDPNYVYNSYGVSLGTANMMQVG